MKLPFFHKLQISPEPILVDDEISESIARDADAHDNNWQLTKYGDTEQLDAFWTEVEQDLKKDPEWHTFTD